MHGNRTNGLFAPWRNQLALGGLERKGLSYEHIRHPDGHIGARGDAEEGPSLQKMKLVVLLKGEEAVLPHLYPDVFGQNDEGLAFFGLNPHPLKDREMGGFHLFPYVFPRFKLYHAAGGHFPNGKATFGCLSSHPRESPCEKQEGETEEINKGSVNHSLAHDTLLYFMPRYNVLSLYGAQTLA